MRRVRRVCAIAPNCCNEVFNTGWNQGCVDLAEYYGDLGGGLEGCGPQCGCSIPPAEGGGSEGFEPTGSCCEGSPADPPGCDDSICMECVCDLDEACCDFTWDNLCADKANNDCAGSCACGG